jgi:hypothetical protein
MRQLLDLLLGSSCRSGAMIRPGWAGTTVYCPDCQGTGRETPLACRPVGQAARDVSPEGRISDGGSTAREDRAANRRPVTIAFQFDSAKRWPGAEDTYWRGTNDGRVFACCSLTLMRKCASARWCGPGKRSSCAGRRPARARSTSRSNQRLPS